MSDQVGSGRPKTVKNRSKRENIIEAAVRVFARKGFYHAKVKDVAAAAGVADGTIYTYFKNKDDILISLFEQKMDSILQRFSHELNQPMDAPEKLRRFIRLHFEIIKEDCDLAEVFQVELRQSSKFLKDYRNQKFIDYLNIIAGIIEEGRQGRQFKNDINVDMLKIMIFGAVDEVARQWILGASGKYTLESAADQMSRTLIDGLVY